MMGKVFFWILLGVVVAPCQLAAAEPLVVGNFSQKILILHNDERSRLGLPPLQWSEELAADARDWSETMARQGSFGHSPDELRGNQGENLFRGSAGDYDVEEMIAGFVEERDDFHAGIFPDVARDGDWSHVGHYTQLIWRRTTHVGCAMVRAKGWDWLTCRYAPAGNVMGVRVP
ncbi:MAG: hypothetical protein RLY97_849 [Pseudomonadota bacterium]|jgi:Cysteine-rich secretory protein family